jgi:hypothetical protein
MVVINNRLSMSARGRGGAHRGKPRPAKRTPTTPNDYNDDTSTSTPTPSNGSGSNSSSTPSTGTGTATTDGIVGDVTMNEAAAPDAPECLLCCNPIAHFVLVSCSHTAMICATCAMRLRLFMNKEKKEEKKAITPTPTAATPAPAANGESTPSVTPTTPNDVVKEKPKWECPFCKVWLDDTFHHSIA